MTQEVLREQWDAQAKAQTRPAPRKYFEVFVGAILIVPIRSIKAQSEASN